MAELQVCMADVDPLGWEGTVTVEYANADSVALRDLALVCRYGRDAKPGAIPLRIEIVTPDSLVAVETVRLQLPAPEIRQQRAGNADFPETEQVWRKNARLLRRGVYRFRLTPVGERPVEEIRAIGISVTPAGERSK